MLVDATGVVTWRAEYEAFGLAQIEIEVVGNNLRFPGQYFDQETGLHYNWHRYYDPAAGRYLTPDPIGLAGGINLFAYVQNNPVNFTDPYGLWPFGLPGKSDALKNGSSWVDYYLPGMDKTQQQKIVNEVVDELGWKDVKNGLNKFGKDFQPPTPDQLKDLTSDQKKIIDDFFNRIDVPGDIKNRIHDLLYPEINDQGTCPN
ncbi:RHS repeat-associated core domain-containing protein [Dissulfurirhabdus thermomarina]|uniref:RHS repeat-associated core domain-containing protein n=2 Tax=Dissulfurirhabdus thermomarina TaxID=1765737 RepID=A0A6N9TPX1_DISTH|nr:RHS repeat-associated core domain-containing protein [Dissulfurirhabdus thermomarina]NMX23477.1 RHS repeat-associated core domain-containing protein [Dissulfurirhabdus thermomarina]